MSTANKPNFVHLRLRSEFSLSDSTISIESAVKQAKKYNMPALALTDINNGFAWIKFYQTAYKYGIKPILGCDLNIENGQILFLIQNNIGYLNLCKILSKYWQYGKAHITKQELLEITPTLEGLIIIVGGKQSYIYSLLLGNSSNEQDKINKARQELEFWQEIGQDRLYFELQYNQDSSTVWKNALNLAKDIKIPIVATHPIQFLNSEDFDAHEVRVCIAQGETLANP